MESKLENPTNTLCVSSYENHDALELSKEKRAFFLTFILSEGTFLNICFISLYSVLTKLLGYINFYISKNIAS